MVAFYILGSAVAIAAAVVAIHYATPHAMQLMDPEWEPGPPPFKPGDAVIVRVLDLHVFPVFEFWGMPAVVIACRWRERKWKVNISRRGAIADHNLDTDAEFVQHDDVVKRLAALDRPKAWNGSWLVRVFTS